MNKSYPQTIILSNPKIDAYKKRRYREIHTAIKRYEFPKAQSLICLLCHDTANDWHHETYDIPHQVVPLCQSCHAKTKGQQKVSFDRSRYSNALESLDCKDTAPHIKMLIERVLDECEQHGNPYRASIANDVSSAHFHNVLVEGMDSPTLRRKFGIRKTNRVRLNIDTDRATIDWFDRERQKRGLSRGDYLLYLLGRLG